MMIYLCIEDLDGSEVELEVELHVTRHPYGGVAYVVDGVLTPVGWLDLDDFGPWRDRIGAEIEQGFDDRYHEARREEQRDRLDAWGPCP